MHHTTENVRAMFNSPPPPSFACDNGPYDKPKA